MLPGGMVSGAINLSRVGEGGSLRLLLHLISLHAVLHGQPSEEYAEKAFLTHAVKAALSMLFVCLPQFCCARAAKVLECKRSCNSVGMAFATLT